MAFFSERYGYTKPSDVIIRERMTLEVSNAICNCFEFFKDDLWNYCQSDDIYDTIKMSIWTFFLNKKRTMYYNGNIIEDYVGNNEVDWFCKLDLIEFTIKCIVQLIQNKTIRDQKILLNFIKRLNGEFKRLNFAYYIIDNKIVDIISEEEIVTVEAALLENRDNIKIHLSKALELYALKPQGDYCNSIKESISAVEAYCREKTGKKSLGDALNKLEKVGIVIPNILKTAFDKLYAYTNQSTTGIRHALMDNEGIYVPKAEEALFMLVSCSAFINYLSKKETIGI